MAKIKRKLIRSFLNTGTPSVPVWSLISKGVPTGTINMNPDVLTETYLDESNATTSVLDYSPTAAFDATAIVGDAVYDWVDSTRRGRDILSDAETELVNVWAYKTNSGSYFTAEKQDCSVQCDSFGGDGGNAARIQYTVNYQDEPVIGSFDASDLVFWPAPVLTALTTLDIGGLTLSPAFDGSWLWYTLAVANGVASVTMDSTLSGATLVQKDNADTTIPQGDPASLDVGDNDLKVEVTMGSETVTYHIIVTREAA